MSLILGDIHALGLKMILAHRSAKVDAPGLVNFITAVPYHFCPSLPAAFMQPGASTLADLCISCPHSPAHVSHVVEIASVSEVFSYLALLRLCPSDSLRETVHGTCPDQFMIQYALASHLHKYEQYASFPHGI